MLKIRCFGPLEVEIDGQPVSATRSKKSMWLLGLLLLKPGSRVERMWLAGMLWPDVYFSTGLTNLRPVIHDLKRLLGSESYRLNVSDRGSLSFDITSVEVDLVSFDRTIRSPDVSDLQQAVDLYTGPLFEGCPDEWAEIERTNRQNECANALQILGHHRLDAGDAQAAIAFFTRLLQLDPWKEDAIRGVMRAYLLLGELNLALHTYRQHATRLGSEFASLPDRETQDLYQQLREDAQTRRLTGKQPTNKTTPPNNIPTPVTPLIGREDEQFELMSQLRQSRMVTLTGVGGIGKTRLAIAVASKGALSGPDGVWFVGFESLRDECLVAREIASVLGLREETGKNVLQSLTDFLRKKRCILVLDNCEHLLNAVTEIASHLLTECAELRILATSREALGIPGEFAWIVPGLATPESDHLPQRRTTLLNVLMGYESVQLFIERARAIHKDFDLEADNALPIAKICQVLEGNPLAIEIAAAGVRSMSPGQIFANLVDNLTYSTARRSSLQPRQQTLHATLTWSYDLLSAPERTLLQRISMFANGFGAEAARAVCSGGSIEADQVNDLLTALIDKSLLLYDRSPVDEGRYRMLDMVRQFAADKRLATEDADQVKSRHWDWYFSLVLRAEPHLKGPDQLMWLAKLSAEHENLRVALACDRQVLHAALRLAGNLHWFWCTVGNYSEGRFYLARALARPWGSQDSDARSFALDAAGDLAFRQGDYTTAETHAEEALKLQIASNDAPGKAASLDLLGRVSGEKGDQEKARDLCEKALKIRRQINDQWAVSESLQSLSRVARRLSQSEIALELVQEALEIKQTLGDIGGIATCLDGVGQILSSRDPVRAEALCEESLAIRRQLGDLAGIANSLEGLGNVAFYQRNYEAARSRNEESLAIRRQLGDRVGIAYCLFWLAQIGKRQDNLDQAKVALQESVSLLREAEHFFIVHSLGLLGHVERDTGNYPRACALYQESLLLRRKLNQIVPIICSFEDIAGLAARQGQWQKAAQLLGAAQALAEANHCPSPAGDKEEYARTRSLIEAAQNPTTFQNQWLAGKRLSLDQAQNLALTP